ncbi:MAG: M28 family peptidase [Halioglobus sp.]
MFQRFLVCAAALLLLPACAEINTRVLSNDTFEGRDNASAGSLLAQDYLIDLLSEGTLGLNAGASGDAAFRQTFTGGTNILALIPGSDLADEYVIVGAHYDHLASCRQLTPGDTVCNGATDNAAGVAAVLDIGLALAQPNKAPRRSVILAFWDREEDGLRGSAHYVNNPLVPLADTVAYINFDILGSNLLPSLREASFAIGAETGGSALVNAVQAAIATQPLNTRLFSAIFGQNRSDYANFIAAGVPTVFFSDSTGPCYHTTGDDVDVVDFGKLKQQVLIALELATQLASGAVSPAFAAGAPLATFDDAVTLDALLQLALTDISRFSPANQAAIIANASSMASIVADGSAGFSGADINTTLGIAAQLVGLLTTGTCEGFLAAP